MSSECSSEKVFHLLELQFGSSWLSVGILLVLITIGLYIVATIAAALFSSWGDHPDVSSEANLYAQENGGLLHSIQLSILASLRKKQEGVLFIFGEYGSGKTTNIISALKRSEPVELTKKIPPYEYVNLTNVSSINQALFKLLSYREKLFVMLLGLTLITFYVHLLNTFPNCVEPYSIVIATSFIFFTFLFLEDRYCILFAFFNFVCAKNFILDDLERSSLSNSEIVVLLKKLTSVSSGSFIVPIGHHNDEDKMFWLETAGKENAEYEIIPTLDVVIVGMLKDNFVEDLFGSIDESDELWSTFISARDVLRLKYQHESLLRRFRPIILSNFKNDSNKDCIDEVLYRVLVIHIFINEFFRKFNKVNIYDRLNVLRLSVHGGHKHGHYLQINKTTTTDIFSDYEVKLINSFLKSIKLYMIIDEPILFGKSVNNLIEEHVLLEELGVIIKNCFDTRN